MNESFGGYNGYGYNEDGTEKNRDDLESSNYGTNDTPEHSTLDSYDKEEEYPYDAEDHLKDQISDSREELDAVKDELERKPDNEKLLGYVAMIEEHLAKLKEELLAERNGEKPTVINAETIDQPETADTVIHRDEAPKQRDGFANAEGLYPDREGRLWSALEDAIMSDRGGE